MDLSLDARLDAYPDLPPDERAGLQARVAAERPDLGPALKEAEVLARLLDGIREGGEAAYVAELAAGQATGTLAPSEAVAWARLAARSAIDPALKARIQAVEARVSALDAALQDPLARFAQLTSGATGSQKRTPAPGARAERAAVPGARRAVPRWERAVVMAAVTLVVLLGGLQFFLRPSPYAFTREEVGTEEFGALRGEAPAATDPVEARYLDALGALAGAQRAFLGLPLGPDPERLAGAAQQLEGVVQGAAPGSFVRLEAAYRLAKARLLLGEAAAARPLLTEVVQGQGRYAPEAAAILDRLDSEP